jgi:hypothetical protein
MEHIFYLSLAHSLAVGNSGFCHVPCSPPAFLIEGRKKIKNIFHNICPAVIFGGMTKIFSCLALRYDMAINILYPTRFMIEFHSCSKTEGNEEEKNDEAFISLLNLLSEIANYHLLCAHIM